MWERAGGERTQGSPLPVSVAGVRERLVEVEVRDGLGVGEVEVGRLVEEELALGRGARGGERRKSVGKLEMEEDGLDGGGIGEEAGIFISPPQAGHRSGSTSQMSARAAPSDARGVRWTLRGPRGGSPGEE